MNDKNYTLLLIAFALVIVFALTMYSVFDSPKYNPVQAVMLSSEVVLPVTVGNTIPEETQAEATPDSGTLININTATVTELMELDEIGEKKAQAIVDYRNENGVFRNVYELANVSGITVRIVELNIHRITI